MELSKFLEYNGVHLIDPQNEFHASCIAFYDERGYLSPKQVQSLKFYVFSAEDIERLTASTTTTHQPTKVVVESDTVKRRPTLPTSVTPIPAAKKLSKKKKKKKAKKLMKGAEELPF